MRLRKPAPMSPGTKRTLEALRDPKQPWNQFPRRQINFVTYTVRHPRRMLRLAGYHVMDWILK